MLGYDQPIILHLIDIPQAQKALKGVAMELGDCAFPLLQGIVCTDDLKTGIFEIIKDSVTLKPLFWLELSLEERDKREETFLWTMLKFSSLKERLLTIMPTETLKFLLSEIQQTPTVLLLQLMLRIFPRRTLLP